MKIFTLQKSILLLLAAFLFAPLLRAQNVTLNTQAQVDAFSYTSVTGNLTIRGASITDLSPLSTLTSVGGVMSIINNPILTNIDGLSSLTSVGGDTHIYNNSAMTNIDGFSLLTSIGGEIAMFNNNSLTNIDGFSSLTSLGKLGIFNNTVLSEFCGLYPLLNGGGQSGPYQVSGNAVNPTEQEIINGGLCAQTGEALDFDGANDYVGIPYNFGGALTEFTIEAWINCEGPTGSFQSIVGNTGLNFVHLQLFTGGDIAIYASPIAIHLPIIQPTPYNQWRHIAVVAKSGASKIFVDGVQLGATNTQTFTSIPIDLNNFIGRGYGNGRFFNGQIDEVRIWNTARTQAEIQANMNSELNAQTGLIALYHFNQGIAGGDNTSPPINTAIDASGNSYDGALNSFALNGPTSNWVGNGGLGAPTEFNCEQDAVFSQVFANADEGGYADENSRYTMVADDYLATAPFSSIRIWGDNYNSGTFGATETFVVNIYDKNVNNPAIPGIELHSFTVTGTPSGIGYMLEGEGYQVDLDFGTTITLLDGWVSIGRINPGDDADFRAYIQQNTGNMVQWTVRSSGWVERGHDLMFCLGEAAPPPVPVSNWALILGIGLIAFFIVIRTRRQKLA